MNAIIVEDERPAREELEFLINEHSSIRITHCFEDGLDVLKFLHENETDAVFLDINIPSLDGMLLAGSISKFKHRPYIIFTTAYKEHAAKAFELEAFDYLLKPYDEQRIATVLAKLEKAFESKGTQQKTTAVQHQTHQMSDPRLTHINLRKNEKIIVKELVNIYYAEAREKQTLVQADDGLYTMPMNLSEFQALLPNDLFFRCHRSYTVNLEKIREIAPWFNQTYLLHLKDVAVEIPVSRSHVKDFRKRMHIE